MLKDEQPTKGSIKLPNSPEGNTRTENDSTLLINSYGEEGFNFFSTTFFPCLPLMK
jgi:hypothetical protein